MKKKYRRLKIKVISMFVILYTLACGVLLYQEANNVKNEYLTEIYDYEDVSFRLETEDYESEAEFIKTAYDNYYKYAQTNFDDIGFYSMLVDLKNEEKLIEFQNFIIINKMDSQSDDIVDTRILLLDDGFGYRDRDEYDEVNGKLSGEERAEFTHNFKDILEIKGTCDDVYVYADEIRWKDSDKEDWKIYLPDEKIYGNTKYGEEIDFKEWAGNTVFDSNNFHEATYVPYYKSQYAHYGDIVLNKKLNTEAKEICNRIYRAFVNDENTYDYQGQDGLFTCYVGGSGYIYDNMLMPHVYVFHPINIAISRLKVVLVCGAIISIIVIISLYCIINKMYKQHEAYENNRRSLTRGIAHELKTPLAITKGYVENWEYVDENERHKTAGIMIEEIDHMNKMVTDLLELSHLEANVKKMNPESVDIYQLTESVLKRMGLLIQEHKLQVTLINHIENANEHDNCEKKSNEKEYLVEADLEMMRTVLVNFISNAIKYANKNINITISEKGKRVRFEIANDGKEIGLDSIKNIWNEFYRTENAENSRTEGTGLGLAITKKILELHNAKYGCKRNLGYNIFWFEIKKETLLL